MTCDEYNAGIEELVRTQRNPGDLTPSEFLAFQNHQRECRACFEEGLRIGEHLIKTRPEVALMIMLTNLLQNLRIAQARTHDPEIQ